MVFTMPNRGTTPPGEMEGAPVTAALIFTSAAALNPPREPCFAIANLTAFNTGGFLELASTLAARIFAIGSAVTSRILLPIMDAETPVTIAMAEPVTAAYICQFPALRFSTSLREDERSVAK